MSSFLTMPDKTDKTPLKLELDDEVTQKVHRYFEDAYYDAVVLGSKARDRHLQQLSDLLAMEGMGDIPMPWKTSSGVVDPVIREQHTQLHSKLTPPLQRDVLVMVDAQDPQDAESAKKVESLLAWWNSEEKFGKVYTSFLSNGLRDPTAILSCQWQQEYRSERGIGYWDGTSTYEDGQPVLLSVEEQQDGVDYQAVNTIREEVESQKAVYEVIELADFYLYPANTQRKEYARGILIRVMKTEAQLLDGIEENGYDEADVMALIKAGPTETAQGSASDTGDVSPFNMDTNAAVTAVGDHEELFRADGSMNTRAWRDRRDGTDGVQHNHEDGLYECFEYLGFLPRLRDEAGNAQLPEKYSHDRVRALFCPARKITFMLAMAPYQGIPYFHASMIEETNRFLGVGLVQLLRANAMALTFLLRFTLNDIQIKMQPPVITSEESYAENGSFRRYPNAVFTEQVQGETRNMELPQNSGLGMEAMNLLLSRAQSLSAAAGIGQLQQKVRKAGEMQNVLETADSKYGLYGQNLFMPLAEIAAFRVQLELQFNPVFEQTIQTQNGEITVTADDLRKKYRFSAIQISPDSNPETRAARDHQKLSIQAAYFMGTQQFPQWASEIWHGARQALLDLNERDPISLIGDEQKAQAMAQMAIQQAQAQVMAAQAQQQVARALTGQVGGAAPPQGAAGP